MTAVATKQQRLPRAKAIDFANLTVAEMWCLTRIEACQEQHANGEQYLTLPLAGAAAAAESEVVGLLKRSGVVFARETAPFSGTVCVRFTLNDRLKRADKTLRKLIAERQGAGGAG